MILAYPDWPSWRNRSREGTTAVSNCMMMVDVIYGITPRANTAHRARPPPVSMIANPTAPPPTVPICLLIHRFSAVGSTPGQGILAPSRARATIPSVNRMRLRSSGIFQQLIKAENMAPRANYGFTAGFSAGL